LFQCQNGRDNRVAGVEFPRQTARSATSVDRMVPSSSLASRGDVAAAIHHTQELSVQANRAHRPALVLCREKINHRGHGEHRESRVGKLRVLCVLCGSIDRATFSESGLQTKVSRGNDRKLDFPTPPGLICPPCQHQAKLRTYAHKVTSLPMATEIRAQHSASERRTINKDYVGPTTVRSSSALIKSKTDRQGANS
jgi:hypothetical protein